jgi:aspartate dehydrogenase
MFHIMASEMLQKLNRRRLAVIGFGAIGDEIVRCLEIRNQIAALVGFLDLPEKIPQIKGKTKGRFAVVGSLDELLALKPDIVIEAAGHAALKRFGPDVVARGFDLLIASTGALADKKFANQLASAAAFGTEIWIASGAVAGVDGLLAARTVEPRMVKYTSLKAPNAWVGTPAESILVQRQTERVVFFEGTAREAAAQYPQNANVAATVAFACLGLDRTIVQLVSDPSVSGPLGIIEAEGAFGHFKFDILALASPTNPKTSAITGHSLVSAVMDGMCFRALDLIRTDE